MFDVSTTKLGGCRQLVEGDTLSPKQYSKCEQPLDSVHMVVRYNIQCLQCFSSPHCARRGSGHLSVRFTGRQREQPASELSWCVRYYLGKPEDLTSAHTPKAGKRSAIHFGPLRLYRSVMKPGSSQIAVW